MDRVEAVTGHPTPIHRLVDRDLAAALHGPAALNTALTGRTREQVEACYRALLDRTWQDHALETARQRRRADVEDARTEESAIRRGGNR